jgi:hypothetical protein
MGRNLIQPHFFGGFTSDGKQVNGTSAAPITATTAGNGAQTYFTSSTTSGDSRASYNKLFVTGAGGSGEAVRAYALATKAAGTLHGVHATAEVNAGTGVTGEAAGVRATVASATGLTLSGGTYAPLRLDSSLKSALGATKLSWVYMEDLETNKIPLFMNMPVVDTDAMFVAAGTGANSAAVSTGGVAAKVLKCNINGTDYWLPLFSSNS